MALIEFFRRKLSWHYLAGQGDALWQIVGAQIDEAVDAAKLAVKQRMPALALLEALPYIGQTFNLDYPIRFAETQARQYLTDPWTHWENAGTKARMLLELRELGYGNCEAVSYRDLVDTYGNPANTTFGAYSSFWYLLIKQQHPWLPSGRWGPPPVGSGANWGFAPFTWGSTATGGEIEELRRTIAKWKPAASSCRFIEVWVQMDMFGGPTSIVRWPVHEDWELDGNRAAKEFYNYSHQQERV